MPKNGWKQAKAEATPTETKAPKMASEPPSYYDRKAAWRVNRIQMADPYGWHSLTPDVVVYVQSRLAELERLTWGEIFLQRKHWNHPLSVSLLRCPKARHWMKHNMPDQDTLWTLRFSGAERVWGVFAEGVYIVIFWDPDHLIWETAR